MQISKLEIRALDNSTNKRVIDYLKIRTICYNRHGAFASPCKQYIRSCIKGYMLAHINDVKISDERYYLVDCKKCEKGEEFYRRWYKLRFPLSLK